LQFAARRCAAPSFDWRVGGLKPMIGSGGVRAYAENLHGYGSATDHRGRRPLADQLLLR
jgi:hypothetical protein